MPNVAVANITRMEAISTDVNGNYKQYDKINALLAARTLTTLSERLTDAIVELDEVIADADGKVIVSIRGVEGENQFTPDATFRAELLAVQQAVETAATVVAALTVTLP